MTHYRLVDLPADYSALLHPLERDSIGEDAVLVPCNRIEVDDRGRAHACLDCARCGGTHRPRWSPPSAVVRGTTCRGRAVIGLVRQNAPVVKQSK